VSLAVTVDGDAPGDDRAQSDLNHPTLSDDGTFRAPAFGLSPATRPRPQRVNVPFFPASRLIAAVNVSTVCRVPFGLWSLIGLVFDDSVRVQLTVSPPG